MFLLATSEWTADQIERAFNICKDRNLIPPICDQAHYNFMNREIIDTNYRDLFRFRKYGITSWSPLEGGILTGKYLNNNVPAGSRMDDKSFFISLSNVWKKCKDEWEPKLVKLQTFVKEKLNCSLAQLSIAWVIKNKDISTAILGAMKPEQLKENIASLEVYKKLTEENLEEIETILKNAPKGETDYFNFKPICP